MSLGVANLAHGNMLVGNVLTKAPAANINSCLIYTPNLGTTKPGENLKVNSDKFEFTDDKKLKLKGNVELDFPEGLLRAKAARLDRESGQIRFSGGGDIFLDQFYFNAKDGYFNKEDKSISLSEGQTYLNERNLILNFAFLDGSLDNLIRLKDTSITSCADPDEGWIIEAKEIELDSEKNRGLAKNVKIKIMGTTLLALPYIPFSTSEERMTGFLEPSISYSSDGTDFSIPYFAVLSNHSDITLGARNIAERGSGIELNYRYVKKHTKNNLDAFYFNNDKEMQKNFPGFKDSRWAFKIQDSLMLNKTSIFIDWAKASDGLVLRDIPGDITSIGNQRAQNLSQNFLIETKLKNTILTLEHQAYQSLNPILTNGYKKSPSININFSKKFGNFIVSQHLNASKFKAQTIHGYFGYQNMNNNYMRIINNPTEGSRIYSDLSLSKYNHIEGFNIKTNFGLRSINYNLLGNKKASNINVPNALIDINSIFIKASGMEKSTIKPRVVLGYSAYKEQKNNPVFDSDQLSMNNVLFNNDRFSGMDRIGDQKFYTLNLEYKKYHMEIEKFQINISKKYYLEDRKVWMNEMNQKYGGMRGMSMDEEPLMVMSKWMPNMNTMIMTYGGYSDATNDIRKAGVTYKQKIKIGDLGYAKRFSRISGDFNIPMDYSEIFANINLTSQFKFIARLKRDNETNKNLESVVGFEYENCCFSLRLTGSDKNLSKYENNKKIYYPYLTDAWDNIIQIENKSRINFEFELKGFNSSFKKVNRLLENSLLNY